MRELTKKQLSEYFESFLAGREERIRALESFIHRWNAYRQWHADFTAISLHGLDAWFAQRVLDESDAQQKRDSGTIIGDENDTVSPNLPTATLNLAADVGVYFGETLRHNHSHVRWAQITKDRRLADYGHVVLHGFGPVPLNPIRIAVTLAQAIAFDRNGRQRLWELYDYWSRLANENAV